VLSSAISPPRGCPQLNRTETSVLLSYDFSQRHTFDVPPRRARPITLLLLRPPLGKEKSWVRGRQFHLFAPPSSSLTCRHCRTVPASGIRRFSFPSPPLELLQLFLSLSSYQLFRSFFFPPDPSPTTRAWSDDALRLAVVSSPFDISSFRRLFLKGRRLVRRAFASLSL